MRAFLACAVALLLLVVGPRAQERTRTDQKRDEQLGAYLRIGRYADSRRLIDQMLRVRRQEDLENIRAVFAGPNMSIRRGSALDRRVAPDVSHRLRNDRLQIISTVVFDGKALEFVPFFLCASL